MARLLITSTTSTLSMSQVIGLVTMSVVFCAFAVFKCTSYYSQRTRRRKVTTSCYGGCGFSDSDSDLIQYNGEPRFLKTGGGGGDGGVEDNKDVTLWQRSILMGGKCQMPDFSGVIIYDVAGNVLPPRTAAGSRPLS